MELHRRFGDPQSSRDLVVRGTRRNKLQNLELSPGERELFGGDDTRLWPAGHARTGKPVDDMAIERLAHVNGVVGIGENRSKLAMVASGAPPGR